MKFEHKFKSLFWPCSFTFFRSFDEKFVGSLHNSEERFQCFISILWIVQKEIILVPKESWQQIITLEFYYQVDFGKDFIDRFYGDLNLFNDC